MISQRIMIDSGLLVMAVAGLIGWGSSQAEQARLVKDVESLSGTVASQIRNTKDIEHIKFQQVQQLEILKRIESRMFFSPSPKFSLNPDKGILGNF